MQNKLINRSNFPTLQVTLSKKFTNEKGQGYYWLGINGNLCYTCKSFFAALPENCKAADALQVLKANENKFQISHSMMETGETDEDGNPILKPLFTNSGEPVLQIQKAPDVAEGGWD